MKKIDLKEIKSRLKKKSVTFSVRMDEALKRKIDVNAKKSGVTANRLIKTVMDHYCKD